MKLKKVLPIVLVNCCLFFGSAGCNESPINTAVIDTLSEFKHFLLVSDEKTAEIDERLDHIGMIVKNLPLSFHNYWMHQDFHTDLTKLTLWCSHRPEPYRELWRECLNELRGIPYQRDLYKGHITTQEELDLLDQKPPKTCYVEYMDLREGWDAFVRDWAQIKEILEETYGYGGWWSHWEAQWGLLCLKGDVWDEKVSVWVARDSDAPDRLLGVVFAFKQKAVITYSNGAVNDEASLWCFDFLTRRPEVACQGIGKQLLQEMICDLRDNLLADGVMGGVHWKNHSAHALLKRFSFFEHPYTLYDDDYETMLLNLKNRFKFVVETVY